MAAIHPFRALRYSPDVIHDLSRVIAPPYDVIEAEEQERLYQASSYNIVRLILGKQYPTDTSEDNRYPRAAADFANWRKNQVLRQDPTPALYVIEHQFASGGAMRSRLGFIALLELGESIERSVYRHEATLAAPKEDRTRLLEAVPANLEPIFCVFPDRDGTVQGILRGLTKRERMTAAGTLHGEAVFVWVITDPDVIQQVTRQLSSVAVLIADGHHRFEVAVAHRARYGTVMAYCVSMEDPALEVWPIQRVVQYSSKASLQSLQGVCVVQPASDLAEVLRWLTAEGAEGRFGCYDGRGWSCVTVEPERLAAWLMAPPMPLPLAVLDVSLLHGLILPNLGADGADRAGVRYTAEVSQAVRMVDRGQGSSAWLLRGLSLKQVYALATQGLTLPSKSTYFHPKVPSGLMINPLA
ncbi:MAG: DUF1015 domain-containing protein [Candidatus Omnitrophica bacterium]|nr:DUF1015 domain-containing protein [Candidatus Omnitrophota bacterium]